MNATAGLPQKAGAAARLFPCNGCPLARDHRFGEKTGITQSNAGQFNRRLPAGALSHPWERTSARDSC